MKEVCGNLRTNLLVAFSDRKSPSGSLDLATITTHDHKFWLDYVETVLCKRLNLKSQNTEISPRTLRPFGHQTRNKYLYFFTDNTFLGGHLNNPWHSSGGGGFSLTFVNIAEVGDVRQLLEQGQVELSRLEEGSSLSDVDRLDPVTGEGVEHVDVRVTVHLQKNR